MGFVSLPAGRRARSFADYRAGRVEVPVRRVGRVERCHGRVAHAATVLVRVTTLTADAPSGIRTRATTLKGWRPRPLVDGGGRPRIAANGVYTGRAGR